MNWQKIRTDYSEAWNKFKIYYAVTPLEIVDNKLGFYFTDGVHQIKMFQEFDLRYLYDFFDNKKIIVTIRKYITSWYYDIVEENDDECDSFLMQNYSKNHYETRRNAEKAAFKNAFEILNNKLK